jgi:hypothetical protein
VRATRLNSALLQISRIQYFRNNLQTAVSIRSLNFYNEFN